MWRSFHWSKPGYEQRWIVVRVSAQDSWGSALWSALEDWGRNRKVAFIWKRAPTNAGTRRRCGTSSGYGVIHVCNYNYGWNDAARAEVKVNRGHHILKGWVKLNNSVAVESRRSVACHEFGHILGLSHRASPTSCMYNGIDAFPPRPDKHDYHLLRHKTHHHSHRYRGRDNGGRAVVVRSRMPSGPPGRLI